MHWLFYNKKIVSLPVCLFNCYILGVCVYLLINLMMYSTLNMIRKYNNCSLVMSLVLIDEMCVQDIILQPLNGYNIKNKYKQTTKRYTGRVTTKRYTGRDTTKRYTGRGRKEMFYLTMHSTHFIYSYMASDIW